MADDSPSSSAPPLRAPPQAGAGAAEPILRYDRLGGDVKHLLAETSATALALSSKLIAIGTSDGAVSVHDYEGNQIKHYPLHQGPVRCLSFDASAEYLASCCSSEPTTATAATTTTTTQQPQQHYAAITSLYTDETTKLAFKRPLKCVALDPLYASRSSKSREVATADARGRLKLTSAGGWLGRSDRTLPNESPVSALQWVGRTLVWASDGGVRVYDTRAGQVLGSVARPRTTAAAAARTTAPAVRRQGATTPSSLPTPSSSVAPSAPGSPRQGTAASTAIAATAAAAAAALADGSEPLPHAHVRACRLYLSEDERTLYVAWPDAIRVVSISGGGGGVGGSADAAAASRRAVSVVASFPTTGFYCLGAVPHGKDKLAVLALPESSGGDDDNEQEAEEEEEEAEATAAGDDDDNRQQQQQPPRTQPKPFGAHRRLSATAAAPALVRSPGGSGSGYLERYIKARGTGSDALAAAAAALQASVSSSSGATAGGGGSGSRSRLAVVAAPSAVEEEEEQQEDDGQQTAAEEKKEAAPSSSSPSERPHEQRRQPPKTSPSTTARRPELRILALDGGAQFASDALAVRGYASCGPADYSLAPSYGNELALAGALAAAAAAAAATAEAFASASASCGGGGGSGAAATTTTAAPPETATTTTTSTTAAATAAALARLARLQEEGGGAGAGGGGEFMYFILSPRDVVYGRFRDAEDRVAWLMERGRFEDALALAAAAGPGAVPAAVRDAAAAAFLEDLTSRRGEWDRAAAALPALLGDRPQLWERWLHTFAAARKLRALAPRAPTRCPPGPLLSRAAYESVLNALLADPDDHPTLLGLVQTWPNALYRPAVLTDAVAARLRRAAEAAAEAAEAAAGAAGAGAGAGAAGAEAAGGTRSLWQTLALLYKAQGRPDLSLAIYLQLRLPSVFDFLQQRPAEAVGGGGAAGGAAANAAANAAAASSSSSAGLLPFLDGPKAAALFEIDERKATDLLVRNMDAVAPAAVVPALLEAAAEAEGGASTAAPTTPPLAWRRRAHEYLHRVFLADPQAAADHADLQLDLIAEFSPKERLMPFLQASQSYPLEKALGVCREKNLVDEQVFLLSRMGNPRAALELIVEKQRDVPRAIEFVRSQEQQQRLAVEGAATAAQAAAGDGGGAAATAPLPDDPTALLWDQLIAWAIAAGGETTGALLDNLGGSLDPLVVVERIPGDLKVPSLRDRLARAVADHRSGAGLLEGCATILRADAARLVARLGREARRAARDVYVVVDGVVGGAGGGGSRGLAAAAGRGDEAGRKVGGQPPLSSSSTAAPPSLLLKYNASGMPAGACAPEDLPRGAYEALLLVGWGAARASPPPAEAAAARAAATSTTAVRARLAARGALWVGLTAAAREEDERERRRQRPTAGGAGGGAGAAASSSLVATM